LVAFFFVSTQKKQAKKFSLPAFCFASSLILMFVLANRIVFIKTFAYWCFVAIRGCSGKNAILKMKILLLLFV